MAGATQTTLRGEGALIPWQRISAVAHRCDAGYNVRVDTSRLEEVRPEGSIIAFELDDAGWSASAESELASDGSGLSVTTLAESLDDAVEEMTRLLADSTPA